MNFGWQTFRIWRPVAVLSALAPLCVFGQRIQHGDGEIVVRINVALVDDSSRKPVDGAQVIFIGHIASQEMKDRKVDFQYVEFPVTIVDRVSGSISDSNGKASVTGTIDAASPRVFENGEWRRLPTEFLPNGVLVIRKKGFETIVFEMAGNRSSFDKPEGSDPPTFELILKLRPRLSD